MRIILNHSSMCPLYEQLVDQIREAILSGRLKEGEILPSVRALAAELRISSLTVKKAYDRLEEQGLTVTVHGKGSYVAGAAPLLQQEETRREAEEALTDAVQKARTAGLSREEIRSLLDMILEEQS